MTDFKPHSVLGRYIGPCPKCGDPGAVMVDELPLLPDGRVDMNATPKRVNANCRACQQRESKEAKQQQRISRWQKKCQKGKGRLVR